MKRIQFIVKKEVEQSNQTLLYQLLGEYSNELPEKVSKDMRKKAEGLGKTITQLENKIKQWKE